MNKIQNIWTGIKVTIIGFICVMIVLFVLNFDIFNGYIRNEMTELVNSVVTVQVEESNKQLERVIKMLDERDSKALKIAQENSSNITEIGTIMVSIKKNHDKLKSDLVEAMDPEDTDDFAKITIPDAEGKKFPVAYAFYRPYATDGTPWDVGHYPIDFHINIIETENMDGNFDKYVEMYAENNYLAETEGKKFPMDVDDVRWVRKEVSEKSFMFNPKLSLDFIYGDNSIFPGLGLSGWSYGRTTKDVDWKFIKFGFGGHDESIYITGTPFEYNLANHIPLVTNLFTGPIITLSDDLSFEFGGSISVMF